MVVIEQDVLSRAGGGAAMTVAEATLIADNALEHTVRCTLQALLAPELLKSTKGAARIGFTVQNVSLTTVPCGPNSICKVPEYFLYHQ